MDKENSTPKSVAEFLTTRSKLRSMKRSREVPPSESRPKVVAQPSELGGSSSISGPLLERTAFTEKERLCGLRILFHLRYFVKRKRMEQVKLQIMFMLVTKLQRAFRKRQELKRIELERAGNAKLKRMVAFEKGNQATVTDMSELVKVMEEASVEAPVERAVDSSFVTAVVSKDDGTKCVCPTAETILQLSVKRFLMQKFLLRRKGELLIERIALETIGTAKAEVLPPLAGDEVNTVELEPTDILLPKTVPGMFKDGTVVAGPLELVGKNIVLTNSHEWIVDEVEDVEELQIFDTRFDKAAKKIQRWFRGYRTRRKFADLVMRAMEDAKNDIRSKDEVSTDDPNCVIM